MTYSDTFRVIHVPTGEMVDFKGIVKGFQDEITPSWNTEEVYGRMDPIVTYQNTNRKIILNLQFDIVGQSNTKKEPNSLKIITNFIDSYFQHMKKQSMQQP